MVIGDGMADYPISRLNGKTPLMAAETPSMDRLAAEGRCGLLKTIPDGSPTGSAVANLSVLGYDPAVYFSGRGVLEAASLGVELSDGDLAFRCNLISIEDRRIKNHSAGHITTEESMELIRYLNNQLGSDDVIFHPGFGYRHILVLKGGSDKITCVPPHDVPGTPVDDVMVRQVSVDGSGTAEKLNRLILASQEILQDHPVNRERADSRKDSANSIWPWSPGKKPRMPTFESLFGLSGAVISAVDLIKGIGKYIGFDIINVPGATGLYDTDYEGKCDAALKALQSVDFVYLHVEASDEAGHEGDVDLKIKTIEYLDQRILSTLLDTIPCLDEPVAIALLPDHPTPCELRSHVRDAVPFVIRFPRLKGDNVSCYNEESCADGCYGLLEGTDFITSLIKR